MNDLNEILKRLTDKCLITFDETGASVKLTPTGHAKVEKDRYGELLDDEVTLTNAEESI